MFVYISLLDGLRCRSKRKTKNGENSLVFSGKSHGCHFDIMKKLHSNKRFSHFFSKSAILPQKILKTVRVVICMYRHYFK